MTFFVKHMSVSVLKNITIIKNSYLQLGKSISQKMHNFKFSLQLFVKKN